MSKLHDLKNKYYISKKEEEEYKKCAVTKIIENYYKNGEELPQLVLESIDFTSGIQLDYYIQHENNNFHMKTTETIAQNLMDNLPLKMYGQYMDTAWLKTINSEENPIISSLIYREKFDVINKILDLVEKEDKNDDFNREVFYPIFNLENNLMNLLNKDKTKLKKSIKEYFKTYEKALEVCEPFYKQTAQNFKIKPTDIKKWHKEIKSIHLLSSNNDIDKINLYLLKSDEFLDIIKSVFNQYDNAKENKLLKIEYLEEAVKNGQEKIVTYYISEFLKNNLLTQEEIEKTICNAFHKKIKEMTDYITKSFIEEYYNDYKSTYNLKEVYEISSKYGNYKSNYKNLSNLILIDNKEFQENFVSEVLNEKNIILKGLNINQWKHLGIIIGQIKELNGKGFQQSFKQRSNARFNPKEKEFIANNPYEVVYIINQINKLYTGKPESLSEKELDNVYEFFKKEVNNKMINPNFDIEKFKLNNKLNEKFEEKGKSKQLKI